MPSDQAPDCGGLLGSVTEELKAMSGAQMHWEEGPPSLKPTRSLLSKHLKLKNEEK